MEFVLRTHQLTKAYGQMRAVNCVNMHIPKGAIYGFVGRNGSGKTTLIRMVTGLINQTAGDFELYGARSKKDLSFARKKIAAVVETPSIYLNMTARENLILQCKLLGISEDVVDKTLKTVNLFHAGQKKAKNFSLGMKQRLGIAIALIGSPDFLILDEPTNGLDPEGIIEVRELLLRLNREKGITILVSSHILGELSKIATHYGFINRGMLIREYSAQELFSLCRKSARIGVDTTKGIEAVFSSFPNITSYGFLSPSELEVYGEFDITDFALALRSNGITLKRITEKNEDLESIYISLIGGEN